MVLLFFRINNFYKGEAIAGLVEEVGDMDIDREFEEFVRKNYKKLTENQKHVCEKLGINLNN